MKCLKTFFTLLVITCSFLMFTPSSIQAQDTKAKKLSTVLKQYKGKGIAKAKVAVNGKNVDYVSFGKNGKEYGAYRQIDAKTWKEVNNGERASNFRFQEVGRDEWSVYLEDRSRNVFIQIDLHTKQVLHTGEVGQKKQPLYEVLNFSAEGVVDKPTKPYQPEGKPSLKPVNGKDVNYVEFGRNGKKMGIYRQVAAKMWKEIGVAKGAGVFEFTEMNRDEWSVYLKDEKRNVSIQLDLHTKKVMYSDSRGTQKRPLYEIIKSSAKVNGWLVQEVTFSDNAGNKKGQFYQKDGKGWVETSLPNNNVRFSFVERQRDEWSVYLFDQSRNASVQLDLHTQTIYFATAKQKKYPIYKIVDAKSVRKRANNPIVVNPPPKPSLNAPKAQIFGHTTSKENLISNSTMLNNPMANNNQQAIVFVTPNWKSPYNPTAIGVYLHGDKWRIFNQDRSKNIPAGYRFNVLAYSQTGKNVFVHKANKSNIFGSKKHITRIKHPYSNNDQNAKLIVTQNYGTNAKGVYNNHPIGVYYEKGYWTIYNQDLAPMPENAQFNVLILKNDSDAGVEGASVFNHKSTTNNLLKGYAHVSTIDNASTNNNPNVVLFTTSSWNTNTYNKHNSGVYYHSGKWTVYNRDKAKLPENAYFNVLVIDPAKANAGVKNPNGGVKKYDPNKGSSRIRTRTRN